jgi:hypothetical protein
MYDASPEWLTGGSEPDEKMDTILPELMFMIFAIWIWWPE